jgi:hypothetical protein
MQMARRCISIGNDFATLNDFWPVSIELFNLTPHIETNLGSLALVSQKIGQHDWHDFTIHNEA